MIGFSVALEEEALRFLGAAPVFLVTDGEVVFFVVVDDLGLLPPLVMLCFCAIKHDDVMSMVKIRSNNLILVIIKDFRFHGSKIQISE